MKGGGKRVLMRKKEAEQDHEKIRARDGIESEIKSRKRL